MNSFTDFISGFAGSQALLMGAVGIGALIAVFGIFRGFSERTVAAARMAPRHSGQFISRPVSRMDRPRDTFLDAALLPKDADEHFQVAQALMRAGMNGPHAVLNYYLLRVFLGLGLPLAFLGCIWVARMPEAPADFARFFSGMESLTIAQNVALLCGLGFFAPAWWLRRRIKSRQLAIEEAFPNMLDLLQVGVEAGMGFDQALLKVASEIQVGGPEIAEEMIILLSEIQAGRDRDRALMQMARRTGLSEMNSFVNVVIQSTRFGTPMSDALTTYAEEMRDARQMRAEEKANKLPVQMSAVMASMMLPSLIALVLAPIVIRYINTFS